MSTDHEVQECKEWLERHHRYVEPSDDNGHEGLHVFAILQEPVFGKLTDAKCYSVNFGIGPATFTLQACIDVDKKTLSICASVKVGFLSHDLGCVEGGLGSPVVLNFNWFLVSGSLTFTIKNGSLWVHWDIKALGHEFIGDAPLIPIPSLNVSARL
ncbi:hypothetical protein DFP72DRAFT_1072526 [Ephemerocybe angulata]|uniref:Uncharacterized protein n=1 Tax=Ephemerocybe angulata TaxID=980116 RepID=A0A8H6HPQ0_9AGAR|nr:hypothetical protein DFP72DRAFT_1072526 [Tulosesus angulatus]